MFKFASLSEPRSLRFVGAFRARSKMTTHFLLGPLRQLLVGCPPVCASGLPLTGSAGGSPFVLPPRSAANSGGAKERALIFERALTSSFLYLVLVLMLPLLLLTVACERGQQTVSVGYNKDYKPSQPLPFQHDLHAGTYQIPCQYCHTNVAQSAHATVPSLNICMNCHVAVKTDSPWIKKLRESYEAGESIPWVKVYMLPDFVRFNHAPHIKKGVACQTCHGPVESTAQLHQFTDLSMGWCVSCHRKPENNAPTNCGTCHY